MVRSTQPVAFEFQRWFSHSEMAISIALHHAVFTTAWMHTSPHHLPFSRIVVDHHEAISILAQLIRRIRVTVSSSCWHKPNPQPHSPSRTASTKPQINALHRNPESLRAMAAPTSDSEAPDVAGHAHGKLVHARCRTRRIIAGSVRMRASRWDGGFVIHVSPNISQTAQFQANACCLMLRESMAWLADQSGFRRFADSLTSSMNGPTWGSCRSCWIQLAYSVKRSRCVVWDSTLKPTASA